MEELPPSGRANSSLYDREYPDECFPRCEYRTRFKKTSAFAMTEPSFWGSYFRSTSQGGNSDRLSKLEIKTKNKTYQNATINKPKTPASKAGSFNSPWSYEKYKQIFFKGALTKTEIPVVDPHNLYDLLLKYKMSICNEVITLFKEQNIENKKLGVYCKNDYPCVIVQIYGFNDIKGETSSLYSIGIAYFTAITNHISQKYNVPVELVLRSSFGHNIPSISEISTSFRISMGIVPKIYAKILVESLTIFNEKFLVPFLEKSEFTLNLPEVVIEKHNINVEKYNEGKKRIMKKKEAQEVQKWKANNNLFDILCKTGDSGGHKVSYQITRANKYIDLLCDYVSDILKRNESTPNFAEPLNNILGALHYNSSLEVTLIIEKEKYQKSQSEFSQDNEHSEIQMDDEFWKVIGCILYNMNIQHSDLTVIDDLLVEAVANKKLYGLFSLLEEKNLNFIRNSGYQETEDGNGSDSDCEIEDNDKRFYSRKLIVSTGMRAINFALFLSIYLTKSTKLSKETKKFMYYETGDAVKHVCNVLKVLELDEDTLSEKKVKFIDLTHCPTSQDDCELDLSDVYDKLSKKSELIVFDYTSATTQKIRETIIKFIEKVPVIILMNSGLKNEQLGADMNPYGTIRIVSDNQMKVDQLYFILRDLLRHETLPAEVHMIRKAYKHVGAVITNRCIYKNVEYTNRQETMDKLTKQGVQTICEENFNKILNIFQNDQFNDILIPLYQSGLQEVMRKICEDAIYIKQNSYKLRFAIKEICDVVEEYDLSEEISGLSLDSLKQFLELLCDGYKHALVNLTVHHQQPLDIVLWWDIDKIEYLGSDYIRSIINYCEEDSYGEEDFDSILSFYEEDPYILQLILDDFEIFTQSINISDDFAALKYYDDDCLNEEELKELLTEIREKRLLDTISDEFFGTSDSEESEVYEDYLIN